MIDCPQLGLNNLDLPERWHQNVSHFPGKYQVSAIDAPQLYKRCAGAPPNPKRMSVSPQWCLGELAFLNGLGSHGQTASADREEYNERPDQQTQHRPQHTVQQDTGIMGTLPKHIIWPAGENTEGSFLVNGPQQTNRVNRANRVTPNRGIVYNDTFWSPFAWIFIEHRVSVTTQYSIVQFNKIFKECSRTLCSYSQTALIWFLPENRSVSLYRTVL